MCKLIEIAGLPGVGKTTLVSRHRAKLEGQYRIVESRSNTLAQKILARAFRHLWLEWVIDDKEFAHSLTYRLSFRFGLSDKPILFFDSGLIQLLLERVIEKGDAGLESILRIYKKLPLPGLLVYLEDDMAPILDRETNRGTPRYPHIEADILGIRYREANSILKTRMFPFIPELRIVNVHDQDQFLKALLP